MPLSKPVSIATSALPLWAVRRASVAAMKTVLACHPGLFDRLGEYAEKRYAFAPSDLPFVFEILPAKQRIEVYRLSASHCDARVRGPMATLLALLEGRVDGDAVFFSRELEISGDTEAILALRNALDDSNLDLPTDISARVGPLGPPVKWGLEQIRARMLAGRAARWN